MKTKLFLILLLVVSTTTQAQKCQISGEIKGLKNDTLTIMFLPLKLGETPIINEVVCVDGKLNYEVTLVAPMLHLVRISNKKWDNWFSADIFPYNFKINDINFFIESGNKINFLAEAASNGIYIQAIGNRLNEQRNELLKTLYPLHNKLNSALLKYAEAKQTKDSLKIKKEIESVEKIKYRIYPGTVDFIQKYPDWEYSAEVLMQLPMDSCYKYYPTLSKKVQESFFGKHAGDVLFCLKTGDSAPSFTLTDSNGETVTLSDFKGKYVVLEFWGSWCGYCIKDIPKMKQYFDKYKNKATFVSIACRDTEPTWKKSIEKYQIPWTNLLDKDEKLKNKYGVEGFPTKIIINPEGIVTGRFLGEGNEFYTEMDRLFKN